MRVTLIIQCIDAFGFVPAEDGLRFFADGRRFYPVRKSGGFHVATCELPSRFTLSVRSEVYHDLECAVLPENEPVRLNLIRKAPPPRRDAVWFSVGARGMAALEYGYFYIGGTLSRGDELVITENPHRFCLEGRSFLLLDTRSGAEEFVVLGKPRNALMTEYATLKLANRYEPEYSVMLPAFGLYVGGRFPAERPLSGSAALRLYDGSGGEPVRFRAED